MMAAHATHRRRLLLMSLQSSHPLLKPRWQSNGKTKQRNPRTKKSSSKSWLSRHVRDEYVRKATSEGLVSRSYYKLEQMDSSLKLFCNRPNNAMSVVDLGAAPGGWSTYVGRQIGSNGGKLLAVDLLPLQPSAKAELERTFGPDNLMLIQGDFWKSRELLLKTDTEPQHDVVLSDMASNFMGDSQTDALRTMALCERALHLSAALLLKDGGSFVGKYFSCPDEVGLREFAKQHFRRVKTVKPPASRKDSAERYLVAMGFVRERK